MGKKFCKQKQAYRCCKICVTNAAGRRGGSGRAEIAAVTQTLPATDATSSLRESNKRLKTAIVS